MRCISPFPNPIHRKEPIARMKNKVFTIPNILSFFRLLLIPLIVWLYLFRGENLWAVGVFFLSALTDILDGQIARHFNMVSDLGKILDPIADKLTQASMLFCVAVRCVTVRWLLGFMVVKELTQGIVGLIAVRRSGSIPGAYWYGKLSTVFLFLVLGAHLVFKDLPSTVCLTLALVTSAVMLLSLILYLADDARRIKNAKAQ